MDPCIFTLFFLKYRKILWVILTRFQGIVYPVSVTGTFFVGRGAGAGLYTGIHSSWYRLLCNHNTGSKSIVPFIHVYESEVYKKCIANIGLGFKAMVAIVGTFFSFIFYSVVKVEWSPVS